ncbi:MAG: hypothetical protein M0Z95_01150 [Actinomycetota bacterium]|nr:hypothetical protein [Actinomycetota bacterium]
MTGTGRGGPIALDVVRAVGEREAIATAPAPACTRSRWSIRRRFDISPILAPVRSATTSCPPNVQPSTSLRPDPRSSMATSAYDASPRLDYTYGQPAADVTSLYEDIRRLHDDTGELLMQLRRRRRPIRPLPRCGRHVYDPRSTSHRIAASFPAPDPPTSFTHPCSCEQTNSQVLPIGPAVLMAGDRYTYANDNPVNEADPLGLWGWNPISDVTQAAGDVGHFVVTHKKAIEVGAGIALGVAAAATGVGAVIEAAGVASAVAAGATVAEASTGAIVAGLAATAAGSAATYLDSAACAEGNAAACVGRDLGAVGVATGSLATLGSGGLAAGLWGLESLPDAIFQGLGAFSAIFGIAASVFDITTTAAGAATLCRN